MDTRLIIQASHVSKIVNNHSSSITILDNVSFQVNKGESIAITGESGSGKSTLLKLLAGLDQPSSGDILLNEQPLHQLSDDERAHIRASGVGYIFQDFQLVESLTALDNVRLPLELKGTENAAQVAETWLDKVSLKHRLNHYPRQLSGGEQQRVAIARAFAIQPFILFADEPTGNLDTQTGENIIQLLFEMNTSQQTTLVMVTHDMELAKRCTRTIQIHAGQIQQTDEQSRNA